MKSILLPIAMCAAILCSAQSIERQVSASAGTTLSQPSLQMDFTLGESFIQTFSQSTLVVTQGFHQPTSTTASTCLGDFDNNGAVNVSDLLIFSSDFGCTNSCGLTDLDNNGSVNVSDLLIFTSVFGTTCN